MACINSVFLMGTAARDADMRVGKNDNPYGTINLSLERSYRKSDGTTGESTNYFDFYVNGPRATEIDGAKAGSRVIAKCKLQKRKLAYPKPDGKFEYVPSLYCEQIDIMGVSDGDDAGLPEFGETVPAKAKQEEMPW